MKILVPVDGSLYSLKAVESACDLAKAMPPDQIVLLAVAPELFDLEDEGHFVTGKLKAQAQKALEDAMARAQGKGVTPQTLLASGVSVADEIVRVAEEEKFDLIVIGSRGLGAKTSFFLGGTATKVVTYAPCSVLVVKTP
ncbi:MAG: universal stress protein [Deltaproteobacteria bacterium]|nr:MAG: universal stress protein [Deltaproteobacteria bacterium]